MKHRLIGLLQHCLIPRARGSGNSLQFGSRLGGLYVHLPSLLFVTDRPWTGGRLEEALSYYKRSKEFGVERAAMHIRNVRHYRLHSVAVHSPRHPGQRQNPRPENESCRGRGRQETRVMRTAAPLSHRRAGIVCRARSFWEPKIPLRPPPYCLDHHLSAAHTAVRLLPVITKTLTLLYNFLHPAPRQRRVTGRSVWKSVGTSAEIVGHVHSLSANNHLRSPFYYVHQDLASASTSAGYGGRTDCRWPTLPNTHHGP